MSTPSISIVTCSFEQGRFLPETIRSVIEQRYPHLQYIVIDGGSKDGSVDIIKRHSDHIDYWVSEKDRGQTHALRKGFARARGDVLGWLCSDDLLLPGALARVGQFFAENPRVGAVYGNSIWIDASGKAIRTKREPRFNRFVFLHDHNYIPQPSMFWRRELYEQIGGLDERFNLAMDSDLWERLSRVTQIAHIDDFLSCMRYYDEQKTRKLRPAGLREDALIRKRAGRLAGHPYWRPVLKPLARLARVSQKLLAGGYRSPVPEEVTVWLTELRGRV